MPERGPPVAVARHPGWRTRGLIALLAALTLLALAGVSASAGAATVAQQLAVLPTIQPFNGETTSTSHFASRWTAFHFAVAKGRDSSAGWSAVWAYPNVNGAFYNAASYTATAGGAAAAVTMAASPEARSRNFSLWLDARDEAGGAKSGYELRFAFTAEETYAVTLAKWVAGAQTVLASQSNVTFNGGNAFAIADEGGTVSAWTNVGAGFTQLLSASDTAFSSGSVGLSASGNIAKLTTFKAGQLNPPAPTLTSTNPASPADNNSPFVIGSAATGTTVKLYTNATCTGSPVVTGTVAALASPGLQVSVADNTTTSFYATATDNLSNVSDCSTAISYTERSTTGIGAALARLPVLDAFATEENLLSGGGRWTQLSWASHPGRIAGSGKTGGWGPYNAYPAVHGAYWNPTSFADAGEGIAVAATLSVSPSATERWFSLWLEAPEPGRAQSGYELRFTNVDNANRYDVTLSKWVGHENGAGDVEKLHARTAELVRARRPGRDGLRLDRHRLRLRPTPDRERRDLLQRLRRNRRRGQHNACTTVQGGCADERNKRDARELAGPRSVRDGREPAVGRRQMDAAVVGEPSGPGSRQRHVGRLGAVQRVCRGPRRLLEPDDLQRRRQRGGCRGHAVGQPLVERTVVLAVAGHARTGHSAERLRAALHPDRDCEHVQRDAVEVGVGHENGARDRVELRVRDAELIRARRHGGTASVWTDTGAGYRQLLSVSDTTYNRGYAGIEGAGNITRIRNFKAGG